MRPAERMRELNLAWLQQAAPTEHLYQHHWLGERFFHLPGDMVALQEVVWAVKPRLVVSARSDCSGGGKSASSLSSGSGTKRKARSRLYLASQVAGSDRNTIR